MARMLVFDGNERQWHVFVEVLESEGYTVCKACNEDEGLPHPCTKCTALTLRTMQYVVAGAWRVHGQGQQAMRWRASTSLACCSVRTGWRNTRW